MENFVVSARKYRPETFNTVVGQEHVTKTLINEIKNNQLAQAFLFNGPRGVGKTTCARILAKEINKESITDDQYDFSYNIFELDAASNNSVEDIRLLNEQVRIPPQVGKYKVYIIDEVHMLSAAAFNAFLKTLEEPPSYAIFILATTERHKILPTILSRCQVFTFNRITVPDIIAHLKGIGEAESLVMEEEALHIIAQKADGALRDALSIFDQMVSISSDKHLRYEDVVKNLNVLDYDYYFKITDAFSSQDIASVLLIFDEILSNGFDGQIFLNGLANHFRDLMVGRTPDTVKLLDVPPHVHQKYIDTAKTLSQGFLVNAISIVNQFDQNYKLSRNQRLHVELGLIKICYLPSLLKTDQKKKSDSQLNPQIAEAQPIVKTKKKADSDEAVVQVTKKTDKEVSTQEKGDSTQPVKKIKKVKDSGVARLGNLDDILISTSTDVNAKDTSEEPSEQSIEEEHPHKEVNQDDVNQAFKNFVEKLKSEERVIQVSLFSFVNPIWEDGKVVLKLIKQHRIQLEELKVELLQFLRKDMKVSQLQLEVVEVKRKAEGTRAYTGQEKFEVMAKKNPSLQSLKEKLNLTIK